VNDRSLTVCDMRREGGIGVLLQLEIGSLLVHKDFLDVQIGRMQPCINLSRIEPCLGPTATP